MYQLGMCACLSGFGSWNLVSQECRTKADSGDLSLPIHGHVTQVNFLDTSNMNAFWFSDYASFIFRWLYCLFSSTFSLNPRQYTLLWAVGSLSRINGIIEPITPISLVYSKQPKLILTRLRERKKWQTRNTLSGTVPWSGVQLWNPGSGALQGSLSRALMVVES